MSSPKLFQPFKLGDLNLQHRVVLAPLTRFRANDAHDPSPLAPEYYTQRAHAPGTLLISEATFIAPRAGGYANAPGIYTDAQIAGWKKVTDAVHAKGSYIYLQLWALGRAAEPKQLAKEDPSLPYVSASAIRLSNKPKGPEPHALTVPEIKEYVQLYAAAARNAVERAGFDGVEVHGANGYLVDQFIETSSNARTDAYGGSIENRARFALEVVDAIANAVGPKRTAIRLSPWTDVYDSRTPDPVPTYSYLISQLRAQHPDLSYLHVVEPRVNGVTTKEIPAGESNDFVRKLWAGKVLVTAGGYTRETGIEAAEKNDNELIAYGRLFISNPDLVYRLKHNLPLTKGNRKTYYVYGSQDPEGYTSYPFATLQASSRL